MTSLLKKLFVTGLVACSLLATGTLWHLLHIKLRQLMVLN